MHDAFQYYVHIFLGSRAQYKMKMQKYKGPNTEPGGTPRVTGAEDDVGLLY